MPNLLRVLIVDDRRDDAERLLTYLERQGFNPIGRVVRTAEEMRAALRSGTWDVVLSEQALSSFEVVQALDLVKATDPEIPFVVLSDTITEEKVVELMRAGACDCILKDRLVRLAPVVERELREAQNRRARQHAEQEAFRLAAIVRFSADAIISRTLDGVVTSWNPAAERLFGWSAEEAIGRSISFLVPPDQFDAEARCTKRLRRGECVEQIETVRVRKDGTRIDVAITLSPLWDRAGLVVGVSNIARDLTEKRLLEQQYRQAQRMETVGQLAGGVAHDFNNLLTVISGCTDLLLLSLPRSDPSRGLVEEISRAGARSASLTRQLLAFSRKQIVAPRVLDLNTLVIDAEKMLRRTIGEDIRLVSSLQPQLGHVRADSGQLEQVLLNLVINARDAMPTGGTLTITTENVDLEEGNALGHPGVLLGSYVRVAVSDTGSGMTPEVQARIFEPFFTTKEPSRGTGLGLAVVQRIVKEAGGHLGVNSEWGIGSTISVYLPRINLPIRLGKTLPESAVAPRGTETILLVEDDSGVRSLTHHILSNCGYSVLEAAGGDEALHIAGQHEEPIDLLLTDVIMPGMGGRRLAEQVLRIHSETKVLYLSGYTDDTVVRHGILHEEVQFLQKPYSLLGLARKVREVLDDG
jgi:PAS domain S-box-containing protein